MREESVILPALCLDSRCSFTQKNGHDAPQLALLLWSAAAGRERREAAAVWRRSRAARGPELTQRDGQRHHSRHQTHNNQPEERKEWRGVEREESQNGRSISPAKIGGLNKWGAGKQFMEQGGDELLASWQISSRHIITCSEGVCVCVRVVQNSDRH